MEKSEKCLIPYCTSPPSTLQCLPNGTGLKLKSWFGKVNQINGFEHRRHPLFVSRNKLQCQQICQLHFQDSEFTKSKRIRKKIISGSIPSIFPWSSQWIQLAAVQERHPIPASHFELLHRDGGFELHFCFMCEFSTRDLYAWDAHMRVHFRKEPNQMKRQLPPDESSEHIPSKRLKLEDSIQIDDTKVEVKENPHCIIPGCPVLEGVGLYLSNSKESELKEVRPLSKVDRKRALPSTRLPTLCLQDEKARVLEEEGDLRRQMDYLANSMVAGDKAMKQLRMDHAERLQTLRRDVERLKGEEREYQGAIIDLTAKKEAMKQCSADICRRKEQVEVAISVMMKGDPLSPDLVKMEIPEEFKPALHRLQAGRSSLEKELWGIHEEEKLLSASLIESQTALSAARQLLGLCRKELSEASTAMDPSFQARMQQLMEDQRKRLLSYGDLEKRLVDLAVKRRLVLLDVDNAMKPEDVQ